MDIFIGTIGGLAMIVMISALFLRFLREMGLKAVWQEMPKVLLMIFGIGLLELTICGVYYTARVNGTSILDIATIWKEKELLLAGLAPFNWYAAMIAGVFSFWNIYQILRWGQEEGDAKRILWAFFAVPGSYLLFLPVGACFVWTVIILAIRVIDWMVKGKLQEPVSKGIQCVTGKLGSLGFTMLVTLLAILNGVTVLVQFGV